MNCSSGLPARCASAGSLSRSGPIFLFAPAGVNVWHVLHPLASKTALPELLLAGAAIFFCCPFAQARKSFELVTSAVERMRAWPRPQSSVQTTGNVPFLSGVTGSVFVDPGTASSFWPHSGTQKEWFTSTEVIRSSTGVFTGTLSVGEAMSLNAGYENVQKNCCAFTSTTRGFSGSEAAEACGMSSFLASTTALTIEIAVTSAAGIAVQTIS